MFSNLVIMIIEWLSACFCHYMIALYLKYIPGNIFLNSTVFSISEALSILFSHILFIKVGFRICLFTCFAIAFFSLILLMLTETFELISIVPFFVMGSKIGISSAYASVYLANVRTFPTEHLGTMFGICNVVGRSSTVFAPLVAELPSPAPLIVAVILCGISAAAALQLQAMNDGKR